MEKPSGNIVQQESFKKIKTPTGVYTQWTQRWHDMTPFKRRVMLAYAGASIMCYTVYQFENGYHSAIEYSQENKRGVINHSVTQ